MAIMDGGENFMKRMAALQNERKVIEHMRNEVHASIKFKGTIDDAETNRRKAAETLDGARAQAEKIIHQATANATALRVESQKSLADAKQRLADADRAAAACVAEAESAAEAKKAEAQALRDEAAGLQSEAKARNNELLRRLAEVEAERKAAEESRTAFEAKLRALTEALARVR